MDTLYQALYGNYRNRKFSDVWQDLNAFLDDYRNCGIKGQLKEDSIQTLYYLLYARYGNSTVASSDENQFKYKLFTIIFQYGPTWEKRLELQKDIRELSIDDIQDGGKAIYNQAFNPNQAPTTDTTMELPYVANQNTTKYRKSKADAYAIIINLLETDVTEQFLLQFRKLFLVVVTPENPLWYIQEEDE